MRNIWTFVLPKNQMSLSKIGMGNDICLGVSFKSVCFDFFSTYVGISVIENGRNPQF